MNKSLGELFKIGKFAIVGVANTLIDYGVFTLLTQILGVNIYLSQVISYTCGVINSYIFNRSWTFKTGGSFFSPTLIKFLALNLIMLGVSTGLLALFSLYVHALIAKGFSVVISMGISFLINRFWVFGPENPKGDAHSRA